MVFLKVILFDKERNIKPLFVTDSLVYYEKIKEIIQKGIEGP